MRTKDIETVVSALSQYPKAMGFDVKEWLDDDKNIALCQGGDVMLFEYELPGVYTGHYFLVSRGRQAIDVCLSLLDEVFTYDVEVVRGLTPLEKLGARWMNRKLGCESHGVVQTVAGPCELVTLTKQQHKGNN